MRSDALPRSSAGSMYGWTNRIRSLRIFRNQPKMDDLTLCRNVPEDCTHVS